MRSSSARFFQALVALSICIFSGIALSQDAVDSSRFDASRDVGLKEGFANPPDGFGEVPFWWWTGEKLNVDRLLWQLEELSKKGLSGVQVNYAHQDVRDDVQPNWLTYPNEPEVLTEEWFDAFEKVAARCRELNMGIGLSGYTLDWQDSPGNLFDRLIYSDRELQSRTLTVGTKVRLAKGERFSSLASLPPDAESDPYPAEEVVQLVAYPIDASGRLDVADCLPLGRSSLELRDRTDVAPTDYEVWSYRAIREPHTLNPLHLGSGRAVIERFLQPFQARALQTFGGKDDGNSTLGLNYFFQDELQIGTGDAIWCDDLAEEFESRKGYSLWTALPAMFGAFDEALAEKYRLDFMAVRVRLAEERYFIPIFHWHADRGRIYACDSGGRGKDPSEFCDYFSAVRWYTAPGHDTPGGRADFIKNKVSSSIAHFYGRPRVWLEGYHSFGWGASPERLFFATNENFLFGANLLNLHGLYYSTYGGYWEWAPPCYHFRQPYWETFGAFLKYFERLSFALTRGVEQADVVVLYPVSAYQAKTNGERARDVAFEAASRIFSSGRDVLFIDDESLARAEVSEGRLLVSGGSHRVLLLPSLRGARWTSLAKALEFYRSGGTVLALDALPRASDRAGRDDAELDALVREIFGATAAEAESSANAEFVSRNANGGLGVFISNKRESNASADVVSKIREYPGGFAGRWVWSAEPRKEVWFKWIANRLSDESTEYSVRFFCDNSGALFVNGEEICNGADYGTGWFGTVALKNGDVVSIQGVDADEPRRGSAGMFFALVKDGATIATAEDFRCASDGPRDRAWAADPNGVDALESVDVENVHVLHRTGVNTEALGPQGERADDASLWARADRFFKTLPQDVVSSEPNAPFAYMKRSTEDFDLYFVMRGEKRARISFRSLGKVELLDAWDGTSREVVDAVQDEEDGTTSFRWPCEQDEAGLVVFWKNERPSAPLRALETNALEILALDLEVGTARVLANGDERDVRLVATDASGTKRELRGVAPECRAELTLDGDWDFELVPTLDNRWGDFRLPISKQTIGAEAQRFAVDGAGDWLNDFGRKFWELGPLPSDVDVDELDARLAQLRTIDPDEPVEIAGRAYYWRPYSYSSRWGIEGNPGREGYHGLKEKIDSRFIGLGKSADALNETVFAPEEEGTVYYLWSTVAVKRVCGMDVCGAVTPVDVVVGGDAPDALYLDGAPISLEPDAVLDLAVGESPAPVLLRYDSAGRRSCCFVAKRMGASELVVENGADSGAFNGLATGLREETPDYARDGAIARTPLSTIWFDRPGVLDYDVFGTSRAPETQRLEFVAPPGLKSLEIPSRGRVRSLTIDGEAAVGRLETRGVSGKDYWSGARISNDVAIASEDPLAVSFASRDVYWTTLELDAAVERESKVVVEIETLPGVYDGALCPEPIALNCASGRTTLGDWNGRGVLANYSGGAKYSKTFNWDGESASEDRVELDLGGVGVSARVFVNGELVDDVSVPTRRVEIGKYLKRGENRLEVVVYNSLANFYKNIPSRYKDAPVSGLLGPVTIRTRSAVLLKE